MNTQNEAEERVPEIAKKFFYSAIGGIIISTLDLILENILPIPEQAYIRLISNALILLLLGILFLRKEHVTTILRLRKRKVWRLLNTFIFLIAFFAPWVRGCNQETINGFQAVHFSGLWSLSLAGNLAGKSTSAFFDAIFWVIVFFSLIFIIVYAIMNLRKLLIRDAGNRWRIISLGISLFGMIYVLIVSLEGVRDFLWGYWLTWIGLVSSVTLEVQSRRGKEVD